MTYDISYPRLQAAAHSSRTLLYSPELGDAQMTALAMVSAAVDAHKTAAGTRRRPGYFGPERLKPFGPSRYVP